MLCTTCQLANRTCPIYPLDTDEETCVVYEPVNMWKHVCREEEATMFVENGKECSSCRREQKDERKEFGKLAPWVVL